MDYIEIIRILGNAGFYFKNPSTDGVSIFLEEPSCLARTFDIFFGYASTIATLITAMLLFGWGIAAIMNPKNGTMEVVSKNFRNLFMIFCIFSAVKPIVNFIWGGDIFSKTCGTVTLSVEDIKRQLKENGFEEGVGHESLDISFTQTDGTTTGTSYGYVVTSDWVPGAISAQVSDGKTIYEMPDGSKQIRRRNGDAGTRSWRNNNPGNVEYTPRTQGYGAIGTDGRFAIFPDEATGWQALRRLLMEKYAKHSIADIMSKYAPRKDGNNTEAYIQFISQQTGMEPTRTINTMTDTELNALMQAIKRKEGWKAGIIERQ